MKPQLLFIACIWLLISRWSYAQQIVDVLPLTNNIVVVHFDEGFVTHHQKGQRREQEFTTRTVLNVSAATTPATYQLSSPDDPNYAGTKNPTRINRKSKGTEWALLCESYDPTIGCVNTSPDHADEHWLYLTLPTPLQRGKSYTLNTGQLGANGSTWTFTYDEKSIRSEAVHVNQIGYKPNAALKYGYVYHWAGDLGGLDLSAYAGKPFWVINTTNNQVAYSGTLQLAKSKTNVETGQAGDTPNANFAGADVYECNFSALTTPGDYVLAVEGIGRSFPFRINQDVYQEVFGSVMNGLFKNRSGIAISAGAISDQNRPAPHNPNLTPGFTRLYYSTARAADYVTDGGSSQERAAAKAAFEAGKKGAINTWGWYQDAGDWDGYPSHARVPINLLFLYETFPTRFSDNALKLAERGNGQPDILDEARWLLRFYHRTRHAILDNNWGTGGVGGARVFGDLWGDDVREDGTTQASWEDTGRDWYVSGEDVRTTFKYAGMAAQFAYCLSLAGTADPEGINWQQEAIDAYAWGKAHQTAADETPVGDYNLKYDRLYASAMLYRLTGTSSYHDDFKTQFNALDLNNEGLADDVRFGLWAYATLPANRPVDAAIVAAIQTKARNTADDVVVGVANRRAARWGGNFYFPMLVGQASSPQMFEGIMAYGVLKTAQNDKANEYLKYISTTADYFLGNNPLNQTWVTGLGERYPKEIFHLDSWYSGSGTTRTGIVPYGPWRTTTPRPPTGWFDLHFPEKSLYPTGMDNWPGHERWYDQRTAPIPAEFTIHQSLLWSITAYGFLAAIDEPPFQNVPVTGLTVSPQSVTVFVGQSATITPTIQPSNATNPAVTWASADTATATVLGGSITGVKAGTTTVTARTAEGNFSAQIAVTVKPLTDTFTCEGNRFVNGDLEAADLNAFDVRNNVSISSDPHSGRQAAQIGTGTADGYMHQQYYDALPGTYTVQVWTKKVNSPSYALWFMKFIDADGNEITASTVQADIPGGAGYQQLTLGPVQAPANTSKILVGFPTGSGGYVLIDDLCLTGGSSTPVAVCDGNKFTNASFEDADLSAYDTRVNVSISNMAHSGVKAAQIGTGTADGYMHQQCYNAPQGSYTFQVWTKKNGTPAYAVLFMKFIDAAGNEITASTVQKDIPDGADYQQTTLGPVQAPANTSKILVGFPTGSGGYVLIDDLCLTVVSDTQAPTAPTNLSASSVQTTSLQLNWTASTDNVGVTKYEVYQNGQKTGETTASPFSVTGLSPATTYAFTVKALDAAGNASATSTTLTVATLSLDKVRVQYQDGDNKQVTNNNIKPNLKLFNEGQTSIPYQELTVRYWFTAEQFATINTWVDYAQLGNSKVKMKYVRLDQPRNGADGYIEYSFDSSQGNLTPNANSGPIQSRLAKQTWTNFSESDDYSYAGNSDYANNDHITVYRTKAGGSPVLIWGAEPPVVPAVLKLKVQSENKNNNTGTNTISTYLKVVNEGNVPVDYKDLKIRYWFTAEGTQSLNYYLDYAELGSGKVKGQFTRPTPALSGADTYLELTFDASLGTFYPLSNTGNVQYRIAKADWSNFNETNDYSHKAAAPIADNLKITVYHKDQLVYGTEPKSGGRLFAEEPGTGLIIVAFPNPITDQVIVEIRGVGGQTAQLQMLDGQGRAVVDRKIDIISDRHQEKLPMNSQPAGLYLLRVHTSQKDAVLKLIKQ